MAGLNSSRKLHKHGSSDVGNVDAGNVDAGLDVAAANKALRILVTFFPQILPEVFREMLTNFDGDSCLFVIVDQLVNHTDKWVRGRWKVPPREISLDPNSDGDQLAVVPISDCFRLDSYKRAVQLALYQEFKALSKSTVDAVMAENNYSYTHSRPTLQGIAAKSWRGNISKIFATWKRSAGNVSESHSLVRWTSSGEVGNAKLPELKSTGHIELDQELYQTVMIPLIEGLKDEQISEDQALAIEVNEQEAKSAQALQECECCFSDTTFEQMATCTTGGHVICFRCLRQAVREAIFGQSWSRNIDHQSGHVKCLAALPIDICGSCIPRDVAYRAISQSEGGVEQIHILESRLADEALRGSQFPLIRCPFCPYAEVDDLYIPPEKCQYRLNSGDIHYRASILVTYPIKSFGPDLQFAHSSFSPQISSTSI
ncbi:hypothetical protein MMC07_009286 [Pseudocyphellaria aurata]|nr:hypothetical protein [Pseudocyphellaria aurata]